MLGACSIDGKPTFRRYIGLTFAVEKVLLNLIRNIRNKDKGIRCISLASNQIIP
jgi:hypothetical protein